MREQSMASNTSGRPSRFRTLADVFLSLSFTYISLRVVYDCLIGGNEWKQGDWLINNAAGLIRRGPFGSGIISISDVLGINLLLLVSVIQIALLAVLFIAYRLLITEIRNPKISLLFFASPAIFTVFWVADPQGSVRKELIVFAGVSIYALGALRSNYVLLWLGVVLYCVSTLSHEAMTLFAPTLLAIVYLCELHKDSVTQFAITIATILCFSIFAFFFAISNPGTEDINKICSALTDRGLDDSICSGAISWLSYDSAFAFERVISSLDAQSLGGFLISYVAALAPFSYLIWLSDRRVTSGILLVLLALPFVPLYFFAVDWGRWMSFHVFSINIVLACAIIKNRVEIQRAANDFCVLGLMTLAILISPSHTIGIIWGGAARRAASEFWRLLS